MEISEQTIIDLVKGQATIVQAVTDIKERFDKTVPYLMDKDTELENSVKSVEKKVWYFGGAGSALGFVLSHVGSKILGGK